MLAATVALFAAQNPTLDRLDLLAYDGLAPAQSGHADLVLVVIDEASIARLGQWPWPRRLHAQMIDRLRAAGATAAAYAVLFSEPQTGPSDDARASDAALAAALIRYEPRAVLPVAPTLRDGTAERPGPMAELAPLPAFADAARLGHVDLEVDADGVVRRIFLRGGVRRDLPALALALAEVAHPGTLAEPLPGRRADPREMSDGVWRRDHEVLLPRTRLATAGWSFADALESDAFAAAVRGRPVLIGVSARGLGPEFSLAAVDRRSTLSSVYVHLLAYDAARNHAFITPMSALAATALTFTLLIGTMALWPVGRTQRQQLGMAVSLLLPPALAWLLLRTLQLWWGPAPAMLGLLAGYGAYLSMRLSASHRSAERAQRDAQATLDSIGDAVFNLDDDARISYLNATARTLTALPEAIGHTVDEAFAFDADSAERLQDTVRGSLAAQQMMRLADPLLLPAHGQATRALSATVAPLQTEQGRPGGVVIALGDLTDAVASARQLSHAATHDALTGLPNRVLVLDRLRQALARNQRGAGRLAVLFLDLDRFKRINDSLGHHIGDEVLRITAERLQAVCRANDTVGRWGGDEFVLVMEAVDAHDAAAIVADKVVQALSQPLQLDGFDVPCSCSVGIALAPDDGTDADELLAMADAAMYLAKSQSGARHQFYSKDLNRWTRERLELELGMREALQQGAFELHYQPQIELTSGDAIAFEGLLRWRQPDGGVLMPAQFIPLAEESGLIVELGEWVVRAAVGQLAQWRAAGLVVVPIAVNVSARQCVDRRLVAVVRDALAHADVDAALLRLEITESTAMSDSDAAVLLFDELSALGVQISVDDFGTGYSSLARLKRFAIHELKIDRSFVQHMTSNEDDAAIVLGTIALAHGLGLRVIAEGVETAQQQRFLAEHACDAVQGYLHGRPAPAQQVESLLRAARRPD